MDLLSLAFHHFLSGLRVPHQSDSLFRLSFYGIGGPAHPGTDKKFTVDRFASRDGRGMDHGHADNRRLSRCKTARLCKEHVAGSQV